MPIARRDLLALLVVLGAAIASLVVWDYGKVDLGMTIEADTHGLTDPPGVLVTEVTPDGNAARSGFSPFSQIIELTTVDGSDIELGKPIGRTVYGSAPYRTSELWGFFFGIGGPITQIEAGHRPPVEAVDAARIATASAGYLDYGNDEVGVFATIDRTFLEYLLKQSVWIAAFGLVIGVLVWLALSRGLAGPVGRDLAILVGAAAAVPFVLLPVVQVGTTAGIYAGYLAPAAVALILGLTFARSAVDRALRQTGVAVALVATALVALLVVRYMTSSALSPDDRGVILTVVAAIAVVPAIISPMAARRAVPLGLVPAAAMTLFGQQTPDPWLPVVLIAALLVSQLLPVERGLAVIGESLGRVRASPVPVAQVEPVLTAWRDRLCYGLLGISVLVNLIQFSAWSMVVGIGLAILVVITVRRGFLGPEWTDAAVPLAAAVAVPVILFPYEWLESNVPTNTVPTALAALAVGHVLASRHADATLRTRLFMGSAVVTAVVAFLSIQGVNLAIPLIALIALIPAVPAALALGPNGPPAISSRMETLAIALTPGAAATALVPSTNGVLLGLWLIALVVWRQFTLNPLIGFANRTQLQRDLAVAAAETERARLAADLHDDALQQLTMLVRTLDESGQTDAAAEAREVATKLRSVVGDLRLPILDDLGAGAALEWLVERMEPLAGGPVKLERTDASRPPPNVELAVFRVAQEALNNAVRHGRAPIAVRYDVNAEGRVTLAVDDAGSGIEAQAAEEAPGQGHFGLANMQQRAEQIGALLDVRRWPAGGTRVAFEWRPQ